MSALRRSLVDATTGAAEMRKFAPITPVGVAAIVFFGWVLSLAVMAALLGQWHWVAGWAALLLAVFLFVCADSRRVTSASFVAERRSDAWLFFCEKTTSSD